MPDTSELKLHTPLDEAAVRALRIGDQVRLSGTVVTARDRAHKYLVEEARPEDLPFDLAGAVIYHCGPLVEKLGTEYRVIVAGPTTSARMNLYEPEVLRRYGARAIIGKGGMDEATARALADFGAVYLMAAGGASVLLAQHIVRILGVDRLEEFGSPEAMWLVEVKDFPAVVTMDTHGGNLHRDVSKRSEEILARLLS